MRATWTEAERLITATMDGYGRIDVLVNNAGANRIQGFPEVSLETWDWTIDLNLKGPPTSSCRRPPR